MARPLRTAALLVSACAVARHVLVVPCGWRGGLRAGRQGRGHVLRHAAGRPEQADPQAITPGLYIASTSIRFRAAPDVTAEPTGSALKAGEVFEATEVVPATQKGGTSFLRVGPRGWVFDLGVAGAWLGRPIVERVPEEKRALYEELLRDPEKYAAYREVMDDPNYLNRIRERFDERFRTADPAGFAELEESFKRNPEELRKWKEEFQSVEKLASLERVVRNPASGPPTDAADPATKDLLERLKLLQKRTSLVAPKWVKLKANDPRLSRVDEDGAEKKPKVVLDLPGGPEALRQRPAATGWRMGVRLPSVSCLM